MTSTLSSFPSLSEPDFLRVCEAFMERHPPYLHDNETPSSTRREGWREVALREKDGQSYMAITRSLTVFPRKREGEQTAVAELVDDEQQVEIADEHDPEELLCQSTSGSDIVYVDYHVVLSPTYRVPILYLCLRNLPSGLSVHSIDVVYEHLVPEQFKSELRDVGVMGGISVGNHPILGTTAFFVHPCNTSEAMAELRRDGQVHAEEYLALWMGLVGGAVGLSEPLEGGAVGLSEPLDRVAASRTYKSSGPGSSRGT